MAALRSWAKLIAQRITSLTGNCAKTKILTVSKNYTGQLKKPNKLILLGKFAEKTAKYIKVALQRKQNTFKQ